MADLRAVVVVDYQNVHLTGHGLFPKTKYGPKHEALVDPLAFAQQLLLTRNQAQRPGNPAAVLRRVLVYRGQPHPEHEPKPYARNQAQKAQWERDRRVTVTLRPLKYSYERDETGQPLLDSVGKKMVTGKAEKGVDVLCALALVREALLPDVDLVILASQDTDLEPALDEVAALGGTKVETFSWSDPSRHTRQLRLSGARRLWNTRLTEVNFLRCLDRTDYI